jgi:hypothetical protein
MVSIIQNKCSSLRGRCFFFEQIVEDVFGLPNWIFSANELLPFFNNEKSPTVVNFGPGQGAALKGSNPRRIYTGGTPACNGPIHRLGDYFFHGKKCLSLWTIKGLFQEQDFFPQCSKQAPRPCSLPIPTQNIFSSIHHIKSFDACMEH